jgi:glycerol-3-phosphate acyltransferase PlsY
MNDFLWILISFFSGSLPLSVWLSRIFLDVDIRLYGDGNPGATNVFRAGSPLLGVLTLILDVGKAALPVGICYANLNIRGLPMIFIAIAPVLGHAFSPFLGFKGGKALATALGVWIGLTAWPAAVLAVAGVIIGSLLLSTTGWGVLLAMCLILISLLFWNPDPLLYWIWLAETVLLAWTHREDLYQPLGFHSRVMVFLERKAEDQEK